jgi:cytochrome bd-type quinol oxidase subunit 2
MAFDYFDLSMTLPLPHPFYTYALCRAIPHSFSFTRALDSFPRLFASTPDTRLTLFNAVLVALTFPRMIITSLSNVPILLIYD